MTSPLQENISSNVTMANEGLIRLALEWSRSITLTLVICVTVFVLHTRYLKGLREIPGPFRASILPLDRILCTARGHQFATHIAYHEKYGDLVRIGPNHVSFSDPQVIPQVYSINTKYFKVGQK